MVLIVPHITNANSGAPTVTPAIARRSDHANECLKAAVVATSCHAIDVARTADLMPGITTRIISSPGA